MTAFTLLLMLTPALLDRAEPANVAHCSSRADWFVGDGEAAWWIANGRLEPLSAWVRDQDSCLPSWEGPRWGSSWTLENCVKGTINYFRIDNTTAFERNRRELEKAGLIP